MNNLGAISAGVRLNVGSWCFAIYFDFYTWGGEFWFGIGPLCLRLWRNVASGCGFVKLDWNPVPWKEQE